MKSCDKTFDFVATWLVNCRIRQRRIVPIETHHAYCILHGVSSHFFHLIVTGYVLDSDKIVSIEKVLLILFLSGSGCLVVFSTTFCSTTVSFGCKSSCCRPNNFIEWTEVNRIVWSKLQSLIH